MSSHDRRAAGRRRAWGRGPIILKIESLERRALMAGTPLPDLVNASFTTPNNVADWGDSVEVEGQVKNQGDATTTSSFEVAFYASPVRGIDKYSVPLGSVMIPAGLAAGTYVPYSTSVQIPTTPIPDVSSTGGYVYITAVVNATRTVTESNYRNDEDLGPPYDTTPVLIEAPKPADLQGTTLAVSPTTATWGSTISVTAQITNEGAGASPQTVALLSLTPQGLNYNGTTTVGIGTITVPPLQPYQTINLVQNITLPSLEPTQITNYSNFALSMVQDTTYVTDALFPHEPTQGVGLDQTAITIDYDSSSPIPTPGPLPDLAMSSVLVSKSTVNWGSSVQVSTDVQNVGAGAAGPFDVTFLLTGQAGNVNNSIYLGSMTVNGLASDASQELSDTLTLPNRLPSGVSLNSVGYGRILVIADPNNMINESLRSNGDALSGPFILRLPGNATTVPTTQAAGAVPSVQTIAQQTQAAAKAAAGARRAARLQAKALNSTKKLKRRRGEGPASVVHDAVSVGTELYKLPGQAINALKRSL
jgi:CARDB